MLETDVKTSATLAIEKNVRSLLDYACQVGGARARKELEELGKTNQVVKKMIITEAKNKKNAIIHVLASLAKCDDEAMETLISLAKKRVYLAVSYLPNFPDNIGAINTLISLAYGSEAEQSALAELAKNTKNNSNAVLRDTLAELSEYNNYYGASGLAFLAINGDLEAKKVLFSQTSGNAIGELFVLVNNGHQDARTLLFKRAKEGYSRSILNLSLLIQNGDDEALDLLINLATKKDKELEEKPNIYRTSLAIQALVELIHKARSYNLKGTGRDTKVVNALNEVGSSGDITSIKSLIGAFEKIKHEASIIALEYPSLKLLITNILGEQDKSYPRLLDDIPWTLVSKTTYSLKN